MDARPGPIPASPGGPGRGGSRTLVRAAAALVLAAVLAVLALTGRLVTVRPIRPAGTPAAEAAGGGAVFDKVQYVNGIWSSRIVPTVEQQAVPIDRLVPALRADPPAAVREYGHDVGGADNFLVRFTGRVTKVDTASLTGSLTVDVPLEGREMPVRVQIGPIILGTALRDAVGFITFEQFTNQMEYGGVADELNSRVAKDVVGRLDLKSLQGKKVSIAGAFTWDGGSAIDLQVTPVVVSVEG